MIEAQEQDNNSIPTGDKYKNEEPFLNINIKNNFNEAFFHNIYKKLIERMHNNHNSRLSKIEPNNYPMLSTDNTVPNLDNIYKVKDEDKIISSNCNLYSTTNYDEAQKLFNQSSQPLENCNRDEKFNFYKSSSSFGQEINNTNNSFLGRKTALKENPNGSYNHEIFKISKQNSGINNNFANEEEDLHKYLECNEKNEEANKISFDTNFLIESENLFDFNVKDGMSNNVNMNSNINHPQDKEYFDTI